MSGGRSISTKLTHRRVSASSDSLANRGPQPRTSVLGERSESADVIAAAMKPTLGRVVDRSRSNWPLLNERERMNAPGEVKYRVGGSQHRASGAGKGQSDQALSGHHQRRFLVRGDLYDSALTRQ